MPTLTGYRPRRDNGSHWSRLLFDGDEEKCEIQQTKFLGYLWSFGLKDAILRVNLTGDKDDNNNRNKEAYAGLLQFLDDKSLSLIMREAADNGRKTLNILCGHYAGKGKPRVISLYTQLTSLKKDINESVSDYVIRTEINLTALRNARQTVDDVLIITMILKGYEK